MSGTIQNVVQATGNIKKFQLSNGLIKLLPVPIVYIFYKMDYHINTYLYVLILFSALSLFIQLYATHNIIKKYKISTFLKEVTLREISTFIVPLILSLLCYSKIQYTFTSAIFICIGIFLISICFIWFIGLTRNERDWIRTNILTKFAKNNNT